MARKMRRDEKGAIGIEILIVFIAIVLVAAVSAAVLIQTVGYLQQKATATGRETTQEVASGIKVFRVVGHRDSTNNVIDKLAVYIEPNTGGQDIDLSKVVVKISDGNVERILKHSGNTADETALENYDVFDSSNISEWINATATQYSVIIVQDEDGSMDDDVLNTGDKVILLIDTKQVFSSNSGLKPRTKVFGEVRPEFGAPGIIEFTTPPAYTTDVIELQ